MSIDNLSTNYNPVNIEQKWYKIWEQQGYFKPQPNPAMSDKQNAFSIALPPPNVTGSLHMGHGFNNTIMDTLTRYHRMMGHNTLWQPGTDHAGIATQMVVERQLGLQGISRHDLGREKFIDKIWAWKEQSGNTITRQIRRLGSSVDWSRERFTMDDGLSQAVKEVFVRLYDEGLIYRGKRLVNWDCKLKTAISDLEVENRDEKGFMYHVRYPFAAGQTDANGASLDGKYMHIATTRPETILADGCLAVHPDDSRYTHILGKMVHVPLTDRVIPVLADPYPDPEFGTGCVKITPAHDFNDYEVGERQNIEIINLMNLDGTMNENCPPAYQGLDRFDARKKIIADLETHGFLEKVEPHELKRPYGDRSGTVIEPLLTDQWYVAIETLAKPAIEAVQNGDIQFVPQQYTNMYMAWMRDIQDWCISRQLWWGHRIPAWYDDNGNVYVGRDESEVRAKYSLADTPLRQDDDVLDTWFSSALWTFSTLDWTGQTNFDDYGDALQTFHPTSVLVTGFDIIFFWVARMIMMTMHFIKDKDGKPQVPFKTVYVHGLVRDSQGQKMSKSKGNVLDPIDLIDGIDLENLVNKRTQGLMNPKEADNITKQTRQEFPDGIPAFGTDALRFTYASLASTGRDINFDLKRIEGYRNFCNKIWNATRFVLMNCIDKDGRPQNIDKSANPKLWQLPEHWIISRLNATINDIHEHISQYRFDLMSQAIYEFIWNEYCDWYVEFAKSSLNASEQDSTVSDERKAQIRYVLLFVLEMAMKMTHPIMPYLTEEIWQTITPLLGKTGKSIMLSTYPKYDDSKINEQAESDMAWLQSLIGAVRNIRGEMKLGNAVRLPVLIQGVSDEQKASLVRIDNQFKTLAKVDSLTIVKTGEEVPLSSSGMVGQMKVLVPMKGLIDPTAELNRLNKVRDKLQTQADAINKKLSNDNFIAKAPAQVVEAERAKLSELQGQLAEVEKQVGALGNL